MVELPDDAIEALVQAAEHAYEYTPYDEMAEHAWPNVVRAVYPLIAARVRAEGDRELDQALTERDEYHEWADRLAAALGGPGIGEHSSANNPWAAALELASERDARVRAEAVADERQRIADELREVERKAAIAGNWTLHDFVREVRLIREGWAAGSVPVATPPRVEVASIPLDELPDWTELAEAAGATLQNHEIGCSGEYETVMHWPDGRRAGNRDRLAIISEDAEMEQFANAAVGPVATRLQPGRVGFGTDAFEVGGSLPGQPVATPTTPGRVTCRHCGYFVDSDAHERTCGRVATPTEPDGAALITTERRRQVEVEGWTHEHDGRHRRESLALAAAAYATPQDKRAYREVGECIVPAWWPWAPEWWKPTPSDRVRELVKAGALIAAEIDRLRAASPVPAEQPEER